MIPDDNSPSANPSDDLQQPHRKAEVPGSAGAEVDVVSATDEEISARISSRNVPAANGRDKGGIPPSHDIESGQGTSDSL